jgi:hypothetical protein
MSFFTNIRQQSPETKTHVAFVGAVVVVVVIASIWITALPARFAEAERVTGGDKEVLQDTTASDDTLTAVIKQFTASTTEVVKDFNTALDDTKTEQTIVISEVGTSTTDTSSAIITP